MAKIYYCPYCGKTYNFIISNNSTCQGCFTDGVEFSVAEHDSSYYIKMSVEKHGNMMHMNEILLKEISKNPLFDIEKYKISTLKDSKNMSKLLSKSVADNKPKCPTCGSTNIKKISTTSKVVGAAMFGLFSKTARSQFECQNCHYKW